MKIIGMLGGLGPPSTVKYYEWLTQGVQQRTGGTSQGARVLINALDGKDIAAFRARGDDEGEGAFFAAEAQRLQRAGAECILIASNTSHKNAPWVEDAVSIPLIHLAKATARAVVESGQRKVVLLATATTLEGHFYTDILRAAGLDVVIPDADERAYMDEAIYQRLVRNIVAPADKERFAEITKKLIKRHKAEGVILGCTELTLLSLPERFEVPFYDTVRIHVEAALDFAIEA
ncbi:aspartate/glutamate racemase family protein [Devosia nitrariae]|uniref:Aspartate racemase n=1 Tax=Devosia nitrariae TaxID=2071872 RepID=A0ABQ5W828_9HYPH|nr:amino acid racemase [Devosia nitrariae]GLQ56100.1 aspartate racemase [Devosia nitrariae]